MVSWAVQLCVGSWKSEPRNMQPPTDQCGLAVWGRTRDRTVRSRCGMGGIPPPPFPAMPGSAPKSYFPQVVYSSDWFHSAQRDQADAHYTRLPTAVQEPYVVRFSLLVEPMTAISTGLG